MAYMRNPCFGFKGKKVVEAVEEGVVEQTTLNSLVATTS
jgi:hypothetical protein